MSSLLDKAIHGYLLSKNDISLSELHRTFLKEKLLVPILEPAMEFKQGHYDLSVVCIKNEEGLGSIPVFSGIEHLLKWKPMGCLYTSITGYALLGMAAKMDFISSIVVNTSDTPRGAIPRREFNKILSCYSHGDCS